MDSKYTGAQVEELLDQVNAGGGGESSQIGEIRMSNRWDNPFGDKYVLAFGQEISLQAYPDAMKTLLFSGFSDAKTVTYPSLSDPSYTYVLNIPFQISDKLLGKICASVITPSGDNPDEMAMYLSMKCQLDVSTDGVNWTRKYLFDRPEGKIMIVNSPPVVLNKEIIILFSVASFSPDSDAPILEIPKIMKTSDLDEFSNWEELTVSLPDAPSNEWSVSQMAYGNGYYVGRFDCTGAGGTNKATLLKSSNLKDWEYPFDFIHLWDAIDVDAALSVSYAGGKFLFQIGAPSCLIEDLSQPISLASMETHAINGDSFNGKIFDLLYMELMGQQVYFVCTKKETYGVILDAYGKWANYKQPMPTLADGDQIIGIKMLNKASYDKIVILNTAKYFISHNDKEFTPLGIQGATADWRGGEVLWAGSRAFIHHPVGSHSPCVADAVMKLPEMSNPESGLCIYVKLKE